MSPMEITFICWVAVCSLAILAVVSGLAVLFVRDIRSGRV